MFQDPHASKRVSLLAAPMDKPQQSERRRTLSAMSNEVRGKAGVICSKCKLPLRPPWARFCNACGSTQTLDSVTKRREDYEQSMRDISENAAVKPDQVGVKPEPAPTDFKEPPTPLPLPKKSEASVPEVTEAELTKLRDDITAKQANASKLKRVKDTTPWKLSAADAQQLISLQKEVDTLKATLKVKETQKAQQANAPQEAKKREAEAVAKAEQDAKKAALSEEEQRVREDLEGKFSRVEKLQVRQRENAWMISSRDKVLLKSLQRQVLKLRVRLAQMELAKLQKGAEIPQIKKDIETNVSQATRLNSKKPWMRSAAENEQLNVHNKEVERLKQALDMSHKNLTDRARALKALQDELKGRRRHRTSGGLSIVAQLRRKQLKTPWEMTPAELETLAKASQEEEKSGHKCKQCHAVLRTHGARFCQQCGTTQDEGQSALGSPHSTNAAALTAVPSTSSASGDGIVGATSSPSSPVSANQGGGGSGSPFQSPPSTNHHRSVGSPNSKTKSIMAHVSRSKSSQGHFNKPVDSDDEDELLHHGDEALKNVPFTPRVSFGGASTMGGGGGGAGAATFGRARAGMSVAAGAGGGGDDDDEPDDIEDEFMPIIIDNGSHKFKAGFSNWDLPSVLVPSVVGNLSNDTEEESLLFGSEVMEQALDPTVLKRLRWTAPVFSDQPANWDDLEAMWSYLFARLGVDSQAPTEHPVLMTIPTFAPLALKQRITELLFETMHLPALYTESAPLLAAFSYGAATGLVVDIGESGAQIIPVVDGFMIDRAVRRVSHLGGARATHTLMKMLQDRKIDLSRSCASIYQARILGREIKEKLGVLQPSVTRCTAAVADDSLARVFTYSANVLKDRSQDQQVSLPISSTEIHHCAELYFQPKMVLNDKDESIVSIQELTNQVIEACDIDLRRDLLSNIMLSGGVTLIPGFPQRFTRELKLLLPHAASYISARADPNREFSVWTGGSVLANIDSFQERWMSKWEYDETGKTSRSHASSVT